MDSSRSFRTRLRSLARLDRHERSLSLRAVALLAASRVALRVLPFSAVRRYIERGGAPRTPADAGFPAMVRRAVSRAARTLPASSCLERSLVAELLLRRGGHPARLTIGVARAGAAAAPPGLDAHAWVESGALLVAGDEESGRYETLVTFGGGA